VHQLMPMSISLCLSLSLALPLSVSLTGTRVPKVLHTRVPPHHMQGARVGVHDIVMFGMLDSRPLPELVWRQ
jgi:hypothetical protein